MTVNPRCSLCTPGVLPLAFCSRHALALVNRTVSATDLAHLDDEPRAKWHCTRDGVTEPCGDCDGCRYDASIRERPERPAVGQRQWLDDYTDAL